MCMWNKEGQKSLEETVKGEAERPSEKKGSF